SDALRLTSISIRYRPAVTPITSGSPIMCFGLRSSKTMWQFFSSQSHRIADISRFICAYGVPVCHGSAIGYLQKHITVAWLSGIAPTGQVLALQFALHSLHEIGLKFYQRKELGNGGSGVGC